MDLMTVKLGLMFLAVLFFAGSIWLKDDRMRWVAIALLAVAFILRFVGPKRSRDDDDVA
jgi:hypothetical protein